MLPAIASRIPLVRRPKAPALPLDERITHLTELTVQPAGASHHDLVARASGVLNYAALIASDTGMPDLAARLCWRQHQVFAEARNLSRDIAVMSLMPLINPSRLLTREGDGDGAYDVLLRLYQAAQRRGTTTIHDHDVDISPLTRTEEDHRNICQELWMSLLTDGARALARSGHWTKATEAMTTHRGVGNRLLDGRQILIMSLIERGLHQQARETIDSTAPTEPWENAITALLRISCRPEATPAPQPELDHAVQETLALISPPDRATAVFQTRAALAVLDLAHEPASPHVALLHHAVIDAAAHDAYATRDVLNHQPTRSHLTNEQTQKRHTVLTASGLGTGNLPPAHAQPSPHP